MKTGKILILTDAMINLLLGIILLAYSDPVIQLFGLPLAEQAFYPNILGAILLGIGLALLVEYKRKGAFIGLGLGGAIVINIMGGFVLFIWLVSGGLNIPVQGKIILWTLDILLVGISTAELLAYSGSRKNKP